MDLQCVYMYMYLHVFSVVGHCIHKVRSNTKLIDLVKITCTCTCKLHVHVICTSFLL